MRSMEPHPAGGSPRTPLVQEKSPSFSYQQWDQEDRSPDRDAWSIQQSSLVVDARDAGGSSEQQLERLKAGGVNCAVSNPGGSGGDIQDFADKYNFLDQHSKEIVLAVTVRQIRQIHQQGKLARVFHWQSPWGLTTEPRTLASGKTPLRAYYQLGLRITAIALNVANPFGGGCLGPHTGLTRAGRRLVEEIHKLGIILDVGGHTGEQTSLDAIEISAGVPVICSHTNVAALTDNPRCMSDRLIEAIAKTGGVIGITAFNDFHARTRKDVHIARTPQVGLEKHLDQYDYIRKLVGVEHIGLGVDNVEGRSLDSLRQHPEMYSWKQPPLYVKGFETIAELPNVTRGLIHRGWSNGEIQKVLGENWLRVYEKVWGA